jgi:hypothetical protein
MNEIIIEPSARHLLTESDVVGGTTAGLGCREPSLRFDRNERELSITLDL